MVNPNLTLSKERSSAAAISASLPSSVQSCGMTFDPIAMSIF